MSCVFSLIPYHLTHDCGLFSLRWNKFQTHGLQTTDCRKCVLYSLAHTLKTMSEYDVQENPCNGNHSACHPTRSFLDISYPLTRSQRDRIWIMIFSFFLNSHLARWYKFSRRRAISSHSMLTPRIFFVSLGWMSLRNHVSLSHLGAYLTHSIYRDTSLVFCTLVNRSRFLNLLRYEAHTPRQGLQKWYGKN